METCFDNIPDDILYEICKGFSNATLLNVSRINTRLNDFCYPFIEQRKKEYQLKQKVKTITEHILNKNVIKANLNNQQTISFNLGGYHEYRQSIHNIDTSNIYQRLNEEQKEDLFPDFPWLFPEIKAIDIGYTTLYAACDWALIGVVEERELIEIMIKRLIENKYKIILCEDKYNYNQVIEILHDPEKTEDITEMVEKMQI